jgi:hypothetical protein
VGQVSFVVFAGLGVVGVLLVVAVLALSIWSGSELNRERDAGPEIVAPGGEVQVYLSRISPVEGTMGMRAWLYRRGSEGGFGSSDYSGEVRNLLFLGAGEKTARWLLPDHRSIVDTTNDLTAGERDNAAVVATVALVKAAVPDRDLAGGRLLLFDPLGAKVLEVASNVRRLHVASLAGAEIMLLYERDRRLVQARFDSTTLAAHGEAVVDVPQLK